MRVSPFLEILFKLVVSGEQFRRLRNLRQARCQLPVTRSYHVPTILMRSPPTESYSESDFVASRTSQEINASWSGPAPPKSWRSTPQTINRDTPQWRAEAFRVTASHLVGFSSDNHVPSLSLLCLQVILSRCTNSKEFREEIVPHIPAHLRRDLIRHCAIYYPLPTWKLEALWEPEGHTDGEVMIVGRTNSLREDFFKEIAKFSESQQKNDDWEADSHPSETLHSFLCISVSLASSILLGVPPTLTHLTLIDLSSPQPLHRLPKLCPLLVLLDLSYNIWLRELDGEGYRNFERIEWQRWKHLKVLGLRECYVTDELLSRVEDGKWGGIDVIR